MHLRLYPYSTILGILALIGIALVLSVALASGIADRRATRLPPLRTSVAQPLTAVSRDVRAAANLSDAFTSIASSITPGAIKQNDGPIQYVYCMNAQELPCMWAGFEAGDRLQCRPLPLQQLAGVFPGPVQQGQLEQ